MPTSTIEKAVAIYQDHLELFWEAEMDGWMDNRIPTKTNSPWHLLETLLYEHHSLVIPLVNINNLTVYTGAMLNI